MKKFFKTLIFGGLLIFLFLSFPKLSYAQVVINEFSSSTSNDWIELYSPIDVDISNWILDDDGTTTDLKKFEVNTIIGPSTSSYLVVEVGDRLNNPGDTVRLTDNNGEEVDAVAYGGSGNVCLPSTAGSIAKIPDGGNLHDRLAISTKGVTNGNSFTDPCPTPTSVPTNSPTNAPTHSPTNTLTPTPKSTNTLTPTPTKKPTNTPTEPEESPAEGDELVLGSTDPLLSSTPIPTETPEKDNGGKNFPFVPVLFIILGIGFIGSAVFLVLKGRKENLKTLENVEKFTRQDN